LGRSDAAGGENGFDVCLRKALAVAGVRKFDALGSHNAIFVSHPDALDQRLRDDREIRA
jgi:hypothetical protein